MKIKKITYSLSAFLLLTTSLQATSLKEVLEHTIKSNQDIISKSLNNDAFKKYIDEQEGGYYPKLDLTAFVGAKEEQLKPDGASREDTNYKGGNAQLDLEQLLYDGNLTPSLVEEAKARYSANKLKNANDVENILFDSISAYLNLVKFEERIELSKNNLATYEDYLDIATQTERINGEILDKVQTKAKIHSTKSALFDEMNSKNTAKSSFQKNVGMNIEGDICRPIIDESKIPTNIEDLQKLVLENNYQVLQQIESIKEQRAIISQEKSNFLPTLKIKLQGVYDKDFLDDETRSNIYTGKLELKYNIFNGMINSARTQREELFLKEAQSKLDTISKSVLDEVTVAYETYNTSKKQIEELKQFIVENKQIIEIYKDQFDAGTRSFIDVLNVESDLYNSQIALINTEYNMYDSYYKLLKATSSLETAVLNSPAQTCGVSTKQVKSNSTVQDILADDEKEVKATTVSTTSSNDNYALLLASYKDLASAEKTLQNLSSSLEKDTKIKTTQNSNGTYSVAIYNISTLEDAISLKTKYNNNFPSAYYIKKK